jgi:hypothetical protein
MKTGSTDTWPLQPGRELRGIIWGLTQKFGGNVHEKGIVTVAASSQRNGVISDIVDLDKDTSFWTQKESDPWISLDFHDRIVKPTGYTLIIPREMMKWAPKLTRFELQISMDGVHWTTIDDHRTVQGLWDEPDLCHYPLRSTSAEGRYLRIVGVVRRGFSGERGALAVIAWEVFGTIRVRSPDDPAELVENSWDNSSWKSRLQTEPQVRPPARNGICSDGAPYPAELKGLATFLSDRKPDDVLVTDSSGEVFTFDQLRDRGSRMSKPFARDKVELRFVNHRVRVTHYAVSITWVRAGFGLKLEYLTMGRWTTMDIRDKDGGEQLRGGEVHTFALATPVECRQLRIRCTQRLGQAILHGFDVFGYILD